MACQSCGAAALERMLNSPEGQAYLTKSNVLASGLELGSGFAFNLGEIKDFNIGDVHFVIYVPTMENQNAGDVLHFIPVISSISGASFTFLHVYLPPWRNSFYQQARGNVANISRALTSSNVNIIDVVDHNVVKPVFDFLGNKNVVPKTGWFVVMDSRVVVYTEEVQKLINWCKSPDSQKFVNTIFTAGERLPNKQTFIDLANAAYEIVTFKVPANVTTVSKMVNEGKTVCVPFTFFAIHASNPIIDLVNNDERTYEFVSSLKGWEPPTQMLRYFANKLGVKTSFFPSMSYSYFGSRFTVHSKRFVETQPLCWDKLHNYLCYWKYMDAQLPENFGDQFTGDHLWGEEVKQIYQKYRSGRFYVNFSSYQNNKNSLEDLAFSDRQAQPLPEESANVLKQAFDGASVALVVTRDPKYWLETLSRYGLANNVVIATTTFYRMAVSSLNGLVDQNKVKVIDLWEVSDQFKDYDLVIFDLYFNSELAIARLIDQVYPKRMVVFGHNQNQRSLIELTNVLKQVKEYTVIANEFAEPGIALISRLTTDKPRPPSMARRIYNFAKAMARHVQSGMQLVSDADRDARLEVCLLCPMRNNNVCAACGCFLDVRPDGGPGKAAMASEDCPLGKWPKPGQATTAQASVAAAVQQSDVFEQPPVF
jgi:hypothetical protein